MSRQAVSELMDLWTNDPGFREAVRQDPEAAIRQRGVTLDEDEWAAVRAVDWNAPDEELQSRVSKCG